MNPPDAPPGPNVLLAGCSIDDLWAIPGRPTRAVIDLDALHGNFSMLASRADRNEPVIAVVKANAYGHGAVAVAAELVTAGCTHLAVATVDEGLALRNHGIGVSIIVLGPIDDSEIPAALHGDLELTVADEEMIDQVGAAAVALRPRLAPIRLHLKIDTGMRRYGADAADAVRLAQRITAASMLSLESICTHFACADDATDEPIAWQVSAFQALLANLQSAGVTWRYCHAANSAAVLRGASWSTGGIRPGIALYGLPSSVNQVSPRLLTPVLTLRSRLKRVSSLAVDSRVSYGWTYTSPAGECLGLAPIGYADGYQRALSNVAWMAARGERLPVRGRVCMDQTIVGLPASEDFRPGDEVFVAGDGSQGEPTFAQLAALANTIPYELVATLNRRIPRYYTRHGMIEAVEDLHGYRLAASGARVEIECG